MSERERATGPGEEREPGERREGAGEREGEGGETSAACRLLFRPPPLSLLVRTFECYLKLSKAGNCYKVGDTSFSREEGKGGSHSDE